MPVLLAGGGSGGLLLLLLLLLDINLKFLIILVTAHLKLFSATRRLVALHSPYPYQYPSVTLYPHCTRSLSTPSNVDSLHSIVTMLTLPVRIPASPQCSPPHQGHYSCLRPHHAATQPAQTRGSRKYKEDHDTDIRRNRSKIKRGLVNTDNFNSFRQTDECAPSRQNLT